MNKKIKFGHVVFLGRPNVGKSTLINQLLGQKVVITSPKPQTTRKNSRFLLPYKDGYLVLSDTPGVMQKVNEIVSKYINKEPSKELSSADVIIMVLDLSRPKTEEENKAIGLVRKSSAKKILVYNKIDEIDKKLDYLPQYNFLEDEFDDVVYISAKTGKNLKSLLSKIYDLLPEHEYEEIKDEIDSYPNPSSPLLSLDSKEFLAELIREKAYLRLRKEVPYTVHVVVDDVKEKKDIVVVRATIYVVSDRYKKIIIGSGGSMIKKIGQSSRKEMELMSGRHVYLELFVETDTHWPEKYLK